MNLFSYEDVVTGAFRVNAYAKGLQDHHARLEAIMKNPDFLPNPEQLLANARKGGHTKAAPQTNDKT